MSTSPTRAPPGNAASWKTPTDCSGNTCPKEPTCPLFLKHNWTTSPGPSTPESANPWDGKLPLNSSCQKAHSTSCNTGQTKNDLLHLEFGSALLHKHAYLKVAHNDHRWIKYLDV